MTDTCLGKTWPGHSPGSARSAMQMNYLSGSSQACSWLRWRAQAWKPPENTWQRAHLFLSSQVVSWLDSSKRYMRVKVDSLSSFNSPERLMRKWMWKRPLNSQCKYETFSSYFSTWGKCKNKENHKLSQGPMWMYFVSSCFIGPPTRGRWPRLSFCEWCTEVAFLCPPCMCLWYFQHLLGEMYAVFQAA